MLAIGAKPRRTLIFTSRAHTSGYRNRGVAGPRCTKWWR